MFFCPVFAKLSTRILIKAIQTKRSYSEEPDGVWIVGQKVEILHAD